MGADYFAHAIIGVELPDQDSLPRLTTKVRKRAFKHLFEDDGENEFDPKTGKALWSNELEEVKTEESAVIYDTYNEIDESELEEGQKLLKPPEGINFHKGTDGDTIFLGVTISTGSSNGGNDTSFMRMPDVGDVREKLLRLLHPFGLWNESKFGLYVNLYCSY